MSANATHRAMTPIEIAEEYACTAFALCTNTATRAYPHPVLGEFAACDRCGDKLDRIATEGER